MSAGPETAGPSTMKKIGTIPEHWVTARAARPQPCRDAMPSSMSAPDEPISRTSGRLDARAWWADDSITDDASAVKAPLRADESMSTQITSRPDSSVRAVEDAAPGTRD